MSILGAASPCLHACIIGDPLQIELLPILPSSKGCFVEQWMSIICWNVYCIVFPQVIEQLSGHSGVYYCGQQDYVGQY